MEDTIFALSTPIGGAIAVIRISGGEAKAILQRIFTGNIVPRYASFGRIVDEGVTLDEAVAVYFQSPGSYTGEDVAELSVHGGQAVVQGCMELISRYARAAEPGEFTKRAFLNGKMDLTRAEAVMDVINAASSRSASAALRQLEGELGVRIAAIEETLLDALCGIDAAIDYPEELEEDVLSSLPDVIDVARQQIQALIEDGLKSRVLRDGALVVIAGRPNAGKSSLLNAITGTQRAIVTALPGTTRDIIEEQLSICGMPVRLVDTAGIRNTDDVVEREGVARAKNIIERADLVLLAFDSAACLTHEDAELCALICAKPCVAVLCKTDLAPAVTPDQVQAMCAVPPIMVSADTGEGLTELKAQIARHIAPGESALVTNVRHIEALRLAESALICAACAVDVDCIATDIRTSLTALGAITGREVDAEVIDGIFRRFCVGK
ncbi:MAG: tRNA uridine-5-carboxymethylaminomethyl(34) synthesis GTPase MnmE [Clostridia bacterium]